MLTRKKRKKDEDLKNKIDKVPVKPSPTMVLLNKQEDQLHEDKVNDENKENKVQTGSVAKTNPNNKANDKNKENEVWTGSDT
jgi:hypothetical protein